MFQNADYDALLPTTSEGMESILWRWRSDAPSQSRDNKEAEHLACRNISSHAAEHALYWCRDQGRPIGQVERYVDEAVEFVSTVYNAVTNGPRVKPLDRFWLHQNILAFLQRAKPNERETPIWPVSVKQAADTYLAFPWLQNPYLDWVLMDALVFGETTIFIDQWSTKRYGTSYAAFGPTWKAKLWRLVMTPISFVSGWIVPGLIAWWFVDRHPIATLWAAGIYYGLSLLMIVRFIVARITFRVREGAFPHRWNELLIQSMLAAYDEMREETIHVPSLQRALLAARERGAVWPPQVYAIVDLVAARTPSSWSRGLIGKRG